MTSNAPGQPDRKRIRILLVDDTALIRQVVGDFLAREPGLELVGTAENGRAALTKIHLLEPDAVILDLEMPVMDGWETLKAIRLSHQRLPVIVFSALVLDPAAARRAESLGASACVPKPTGMEDRDAALQSLRERLLAELPSLTEFRDDPPL